VRLKTLGGGEVRLFGAVLERDGPGVVYDSLGVDGTRVKLLSRFDPLHWTEQLKARQVDLVVLHYGTNEGEAADLGTPSYFVLEREHEVRHVPRFGRPTDHAVHAEIHRTGTT
jgi:hypothetical protein